MSRTACKIKNRRNVCKILQFEQRFLLFTYYYIMKREFLGVDSCWQTHKQSKINYGDIYFFKETALFNLLPPFSLFVFLVWPHVGAETRLMRCQNKILSVYIPPQTPHALLHRMAPPRAPSHLRGRSTGLGADCC